LLDGHIPVDGYFATTSELHFYSVAKLAAYENNETEMFNLFRALGAASVARLTGLAQPSPAVDSPAQRVVPKSHRVRRNEWQRSRERY
jgi:hypothetical protein